MRVPAAPFQARAGDRSPPWQVSSAPHGVPGQRDCSLTWATPPTDAEGRTTLDPVPLGRLVLTTRPKQLADPQAWSAFWKVHGNDPGAFEQTQVHLGYIEVRGGGAEVEVVLPASAGY